MEIKKNTEQNTSDEGTVLALQLNLTSVKVDLFMWGKSTERKRRRARENKLIDTISWR